MRTLHLNQFLFESTNQSFFLVSSRKASSSSIKSEEEKELLKELRWHYKQFVRTSKRNKEKLAHVSKGNNY